MKRLIISILAATAFCIHADAQRYTLGKCLEIGLENNYALRIIRNKEQIAHNNATAANAGYLPTLDRRPDMTPRCRETTPRCVLQAKLSRHAIR